MSEAGEVAAVAGVCRRWTRVSVFFVRHGEREDFVNRAWAQENPAVGNDPPLSGQGVLQARETGLCLAGIRFHQIHVSPYVRTVQTACQIMKHNRHFGGAGGGHLTSASPSASPCASPSSPFLVSLSSFSSPPPAPQQPASSKITASPNTMHIDLRVFEWHGPKSKSSPHGLNIRSKEQIMGYMAPGIQIACYPHPAGARPESLPNVPETIQALHSRCRFAMRDIVQEALEQCDAVFSPESEISAPSKPPVTSETLSNLATTLETNSPFVFFSSSTAASSFSSDQLANAELAQDPSTGSRATTMQGASLLSSQLSAALSLSSTPAAAAAADSESLSPVPVASPHPALASASQINQSYRIDANHHRTSEKTRCDDSSPAKTCDAKGESRAIQAKLLPLPTPSQRIVSFSKPASSPPAFLPIGAPDMTPADRDIAGAHHPSSPRITAGSSPLMKPSSPGLVPQIAGALPIPEPRLRRSHFSADLSLSDASMMRSVETATSAYRQDPGEIAIMIVSHAATNLALIRALLAENRNQLAHASSSVSAAEKSAPVRVAMRPGVSSNMLSSSRTAALGSSPSFSVVNAMAQSSSSSQAQQPSSSPQPSLQLQLQSSQSQSLLATQFESLPRQRRSSTPPSFRMGVCSITKVSKTLPDGAWEVVFSGDTDHLTSGEMHHWNFPPEEDVSWP